MTGIPEVPRRSWVKRRLIEVAGWTLVAIGLVALVLPGPGLLTIAAGLVLLAMRYAWARRLLRPVRVKALSLASRGVQTWPRIVFSVLGGLLFIGVGIGWGLGTPVPGWWPLADRWWFLGGWGTGATLIASGAFTLGLMVYSFRRFRGRSLDAALEGGAGGVDGGTRGA